MIKTMKLQAGMGIYELLFVIVIASGIVFYSVRYYQSYRMDADVAQVKYNVNMLFDALYKYYLANCSLNNHPDTPDLSGSSPPSNVAVTMDDLISKGYLTASFPKSPIIDNTTPENSYIMQFNLIPITNRTIKLSPTGTANIGNIILWQAQVSVLLKNSQTAQQYQQLLQADCLSTQTTAGKSVIVTPCSGAAPSSPYYAVFERQPSLASTYVNSTYWTTMPIVKQFTQMYTTYPILLLTNSGSPQAASQYYVCGS